MKKLLLCLLLVLAACETTPVPIPQVNLQPDPNFAPIKGKYNAVVPTGAWSLILEAETGNCSFWSFEANLNDVYQKAAQQALQNTLEKVTFSSAILTPAQLTSQGYDGQIVLHQGNATAKYIAMERFFSFDIRSEIDLEAIAALSDKDGLFKQYALSGQGFGLEKIFSCASINTSVAQAGQSAVTDIVKKAILNLRDGLREKEERKTSPTK